MNRFSFYFYITLWAACVIATGIIAGVFVMIMICAASVVIAKV